MTTRRDFLKTAAAALPVGAIPVASVAAPSAALNAIGGSLAWSAVAAGSTAEAILPVALGSTAMWRALEEIQTKERVRIQWWLEYRRHRIAVRRRREQQMPAKLIWLRKKLKDMRREMISTRYNKPASSGVVMVALPRRFQYKAREARERRAMRALGFFKMPWEQ